MNENEWFSNQILLYMCDVFDWALMEEIKPVVAEEKDFDYRDVSKKITLFRNFGLSGL